MKNLIHSDAENLVKELSSCVEVEAIALGGSRAGGNFDEKSDYDLYVYCSGETPEATRRALLQKYCSHMEIGNRYWECEDDVTLNCGTDMDIVYRSYEGFAAEIADVADAFHARNGYTTCLWYNLVNCKILFDRTGRLTDLQKTYTREYPKRLKDNIISRNFALLRGTLPAYEMQIAKAAKRGDFVSVNHRVAEFLASYFDIIFALNGRLHPGEKRLLELSEKMCPILPLDFRANIDRLLLNMYSAPQALNSAVSRVIDNLQDVINRA